MAKKLGLTLQYPEGYLEAQAASQQQDEDKGKNRKRKASIGVCVCVCVCVCVHAGVCCVFMHVCISVWVHMHTCAYVHTCIARAVSVLSVVLLSPSRQPHLKPSQEEGIQIHFNKGAETPYL